MKVDSWVMRGVGEPLERVTRTEAEPGPDEVMVEVAGCGICHTDLGFLYDGVPLRGSLPLTLGHEISGTVCATGSRAGDWMGRRVVVPAVIPCGKCDLCRAGRGSICPRQIFPGNDIHGGFASKVRVPAAGLCPVPRLPEGIDLAGLAVLADAVTTPYQSIRRSRLGEGDFAVFVGVGGVGAFGVQIARALGATVAAIDVDSDRLALVAEHGAEVTFDAREHPVRELRKRLHGLVKERGLPQTCWKIFETSGTTAGQEMAFGLLGHGAYLGIVGFTPADVTVRLSNLMAFDACAEGNWGCLPELYPEALELVLAGKVEVGPFIETHPMSRVNEVLAAAHRRELKKRVVLLPDFDAE